MFSFFKKKTQKPADDAGQAAKEDVTNQDAVDQALPAAPPAAVEAPLVPDAPAESTEPAESAESAAVPVPAPAPAEKSSWLSRLKQGLSRTGQHLGGLFVGVK